MSGVLHTPGPFTAQELRVMQEALAQMDAGERNLTEAGEIALASARKKLSLRRTGYVIVRATLLSDAADAIDAATWGAVADDEAAHPIAKAWRRVERRCLAAISNTARS